MHHYPFGWSRLEMQILIIALIGIYFFGAALLLKYGNRFSSYMQRTRRAPKVSHEFRGMFP